MPFAKGKSGNPGGKRKSAYDLGAVARLHTKKAVDTVVGLLDSGDEKVRLSAALALLDRGYGKPAQLVTGPGDDGAHRFELIAPWMSEQIATRNG